jgi:CcmD family protein
MSGITYLWLASLIIWVFFFAYLGYLNFRQKKLHSRLQALIKKCGLNLDP